MNYGKKSASDKQKAISKKTGMKKKRVGVALFKTVLVCVFVMFVAVFAIGVGLIKSVIDNAPAPNSINVAPDAFASTILDQDGNEMQRLVASGSNRTFKDIDEIPLDLQQAFVAIEDERFYEHNGIDLRGIIRAGIKGISNRSFSQGASTITQQLIKNNVLTDWTEEQTLREKAERKLQEQYLAIQLEKKMDKEEILQHYMNTINLGQNTLGVQAASKRYFGKDVEELTLSECVVIAGITKNPTRYNPITNPDENQKRRVLVLGNMLEQGYITDAEYNEALADDVYARIQTVNSEMDVSTKYTYYEDAIIQQVLNDLQDIGYTDAQAEYALYSSGLNIYAAQDQEIQAICDDEFSNQANYPKGTIVELTFNLTIHRANGEVENYSDSNMETHYKDVYGSDYNQNFADEVSAMAAYDQYKLEVLGIGEDDVVDENINCVPQPQASVVVMDQSSGFVLAIVGGRGEKVTNRAFNRATDSTRLPGSTFKILSTYAPALDNAGMTLASVQYDAEYYYEDGKKVNNWDGSSYKGYSTLRYGIEQSKNIVAVKTLTEITPQLGYNYLLNFGITTLADNNTQQNGKVYSDINQSLALGGITNGVKNVELTAAFAAIANEGYYNEPKFYTKIEDYEGNIIIDNTGSESTRVIKDTTAALLTNAMEDVVTKGTGKALALTNMPVAGKTGTTTGDKDLWFSGYTPYYTCSVWGGFDNHVDAPGGGAYTSFHKTLWKNIMARIHSELPRKDFKMPSSMTTATVCRKSGKLVVEGACDADPRGSMAIKEYFAPGTAPTDYCDVHVSAQICGISGKKATEACPHSSRTSRVCLIIKPDDLESGYTEDSQYAVPPTCTLHSGLPDDNEMPPEEDEEEYEDNWDLPDLEDEFEDDIWSDGFIPLVGQAIKKFKFYLF